MRANKGRQKNSKLSRIGRMGVPSVGFQENISAAATQLAHNVIPTLAERRIYVSRDLTLIQRSHHVVFLT